MTHGAPAQKPLRFEVKHVNVIDRLIAVAAAEVGYLEKKSNASLDDKIANAGSNNYTKYNRDMRQWAGSAGLSDQWCQNFVDWVFVVAFGLELARLLIHLFTNYTPDGSGAFKKYGQYFKRGTKTPARGDVIYFYNSSKRRIGHVGIVTKVTSTKVYTIEGNTSGASTLVTNGGGVREKSYSLSSTYIDGYGRPDYSQVAADGYGVPLVPPTITYKLGDRVLRNYTEGPDVKELQEALISLGYSCGDYGADGEFGDCTEMALRAFQAATGLAVNGVYAPADHGAMLVALAKQPSEADFADAKSVLIDAGKRCYIRKGPSTDYDDIGIAHGGDKYPYAGKTSEKGWNKVIFDGQDAWISGKYSKLVS